MKQVNSVLNPVKYRIDFKFFFLEFKTFHNLTLPYLQDNSIQNLKVKWPNAPRYLLDLSPS